MYKCFLFCLTLLISGSVFSQGSPYFKGDKDFQITSVPDSLKDQSFVMLCVRDQYEISAKRVKRATLLYGGDTHASVEHLRIRAALLDEAAVDRFGFVSFEKDELQHVEILKPDGKVEVVDITEAVEVKREAIESKGLQNSKRARRRNNKNEEKFYKLALTNLTPGDIVDITFRYKEDFSGLFEMTFEVLPKSFPVLKQKVHFMFEDELAKPRETWKKVKFRFSSLHGAPEIREVGSGYFVFEDSTSGVVNEERWSYPAAELPTIKYGFYTYGTLNYLDQEYEKGFLLPPLPESKFLEIAKDAARVGAVADDADIEFFLKKSDPKRKKLMKQEPMKYYHELYNMQRQYMISSTTIPITAPALKSVMRYWFVDYDVPASAVAVLPRYLESYDDLTFFREADFGFRVPDKDNVYVFDMSTFRQLGEIPYQYEGCLAIEVPLYSPLDVRAMDRKAGRETPDSGSDIYRLPVSTHEDNRQHHEMSVTFDIANNETEIQTELSGHGHLRENIYPYIISLKPFEEDKAYFKKMGLTTPWRISSTDKEMEELQDNKEERLKSYVEDSWGEVEVIELSTVSAGRTPEAPVATVKQHVKTSDMLRKVGPNYIFSAGMLIHEQANFTGDERERKGDVYMDYARTYDETISIAIPEGYTAEGLDKFNFDVDNETGSFKSEATLAGDRIIINAKKVYKHNFEKKENWPQMLEFIDAAYQFTQANILFRKQ